MKDDAPSDPLAPVVGSDPAPATHAAPSGDAPAAKSRPKGGRRSAAEEVDAYLAKHGLVAAPAGGPAPDPAGPPPVAMAMPEPFDEAATRAGIEGLVKSASGIAEWTVAGKAEEITGDEGQAKHFGAAAAMPEPTQRLVIESGVAWARKTGTNVGPELGVMAGLGQWAVQLRGVVADLREIAAMRRGESGKQESRKEPLPHAST
jgi:hypothetical protein